MILASFHNEQSPDHVEDRNATLWEGTNGKRVLKIELNGRFANF